MPNTNPKMKPGAGESTKLSPRTMAESDEKPASGKRSTFDRLLGESAEQKHSRAMEAGFADAAKDVGTPLDWTGVGEGTTDAPPVSKRSTDRGVGPVLVPEAGDSAPPPARDAGAPTLTIAEITSPERVASAGDDALPDVAPHQKKDWEAQRAADPRADADDDVALEDRDTHEKPRQRNVLGRHVVAGIYTVETDYDWNDPEKAQRAEADILRAKQEAESLAPGSDALLKLATEMRAKYGALIGPEADAVDATSHAAIASLLVDVAKEAAAKDAKLEEVKVAAEAERAGRLQEQQRADALAQTAEAERIRADERENSARAARYEAEKAKAEKAKVDDELHVTKQKLADRDEAPAAVPTKKINWVPAALFVSLFVIGFLIWLAISAGDETTPTGPVNVHTPENAAREGAQPTEAQPPTPIPTSTPISISTATSTATSTSTAASAVTSTPSKPTARPSAAVSAAPAPSATPTSTAHDPFAKPDF